MKRSAVIYVFLMLLVTVSCKTKKNTLNGNTNTTTSDHKSEMVEQMLIQATTEKILGNTERAIVLYQEILKLDSKVAVAHFELSEIYRDKKDATNAISHAAEALELAPENEWYAANLGLMYKQVNNFQKSAEVYERLLEEHPSNSQYLFNLAEIYLYQGRLKESLPIYNRIELQMGISEELSLHKNRIYLELGQPDSALAEINRLIESNPLEIRYYGILAETYETLGDDVRALESYQKVLQLEPENGYVHLSLYEYYKYHGQKDKSAAELKASFQSGRVDLETKVEILSEYFVNSERNEELKTEAYELLEIAINVHPEESRGYAVYADFLIRDERDDEGIKMLKKAVEYDPADFNLRYQLMIAYTVSNKYEEMAQESTKAAELFPSLPTFYYFNGVANIQLKDYEKAVESLEVGKDFVIDNPPLKTEFYQYLGDANHQLEQHEQSDYYYDQALSLNPMNVYVLNNYSYYLALRKTKLDKAEEMAKKVNEIKPNVATYLDTYGWVFYSAGKYVDAEIWLQKALDNGGDSSGEVLEHYGDALFRLGKKGQALEYWKKAAEKPDASKNILEKIEKEQLIE